MEELSSELSATECGHVFQTHCILQALNINQSAQMPPKIALSLSAQSQLLDHPDGGPLAPGNYRARCEREGFHTYRGEQKSEVKKWVAGIRAG